MRKGALAILLLLAATACRPPTPPRQVIFILLDAARADRLSSYGYSRETTPNLDRLAAGGLLFRTHFTHGTDTKEAMPQLLFSRYFVPPIFPASSEIPYKNPSVLFRDVDSQARSLPRILSDAGLHTLAVSSHIFIRNGTRLADEFDELRELDATPDELARGIPYAEAPQVVDAAIRCLEEQADREYFLYLHFMDTHFPHFFGADARRFLGRDAQVPPGLTNEGRPRDANRAATDAEREYLDAVYDGSLAHADREIGRLMRFLEETGRFQDTMIIVTADHGDHLLEVPGRFGHGGPWLDAVAHVPWIISYPSRVRPRAIDKLTEAVDVLPTTLSLLGIPIPPGIRPDGSDASADDYPVDDPVYATAGLRDDEVKLVFRPDSPVLGVQEVAVSEIDGQLYDLASDPREEVDLWSRRPDVVERLLHLYRTSMTAHYMRYEGTRATAQPRRAFAISPVYFEAKPSTRKAPPDLTEVSCGSLGDGWFREAAWWDPMLVLGPRAKAGPVRFPLPDGVYHLRTAVRGSGWIRMQGGHSDLRMEGPPFPRDASVNLGQAWGAEEVDLGIVEISGSTFSSILRPEPGACLLVRYFGFVPLNEGSEMSDEDRRRLRSLGYLD